MSKYYDLIASCDGFDSSWEIVLVDVDKISDMAIASKQAKKLQKIKRFIMSGKIVAPIIINKENKLLEGHHRLTIYLDLNKDMFPCLREVGGGIGEVVRDECFGDRVGRFISYLANNEEQEVFCPSCENKMAFLPRGASPPIRPFDYPESMPSGPLYYCNSGCGLTVNTRFIVWREGRSK